MSQSAALVWGNFKHKLVDHPEIKPGMKVVRREDRTDWTYEHRTNKRRVGRAVNHLSPNQAYTIVGVTETGGLLLEGFQIPVSQKHVRFLEEE